MEQEKVWDAIASSWDKYRDRPCVEIVEFLRNKVGKVLDLGCGSGRNFIKTEGLGFYGIDFSEELLKFAEEKGYVELRKAEVDVIPYEDEVFDWVVFGRVLHCVDSAEKRRKSLKEVYRVLKNGGEGLISVWGRGQGRMKNKEKVCFVPWSVGGKKYLRYTYIYDEDELVRDLENVGFEILKVEEGKNIVVVVRKN